MSSPLFWSMELDPEIPHLELSQVTTMVKGTVLTVGAIRLVRNSTPFKFSKEIEVPPEVDLKTLIVALTAQEHIKLKAKYKKPAV